MSSLPKQAAGPSRLGRPKDASKRAAIIASAKNLFALRSYESVTMEAVALQAGVSKMTVYSHFTDKEILFETVVRSVSDQMLSGGPEAAGTDEPLQQRLTAIGRSFLAESLAPEAVGMLHTLPGTLRHNPVLARRFFEAGPARVATALASTLSAAVADGELAIDDLELAAYDLVSLWEGGLRIQLAFQVVDPITPAEIARRAERGTALFMRAHRPPDPDKQAIPP